VTDATGEPVRKRKRRRRSKSGQAQPSAVADVSVDAAGAKAVAAAPGAENSSRKRSKKNRQRRSLQGRPLAASEKARPVSDGAKQQPPQLAVSSTRIDERPSAGNNAYERRGNGQAFSYGSDMGSPLYAALDLGTNNCRLLIAQPTRPGQFRVVDAFSRIVRLGEGLGASGRLSQDAMDRSIEALKVCAAKLKTRDIRKTRLIATEAARAAENGEAFLERVLAETGLELEIINRETEARLAVSGCSSLVGRETKSVVLFDIGGGSSEIAVIKIGENRSSRLANHITHWTSLPVGVVTLSERHGGQDVSPASFEAMVTEVQGMLSNFDCPAIHTLENPGDENGFHLIGTSGTVTTLAGVHLDLPRYDRRKVDGLWLSDDEVSAMQARLLSWDFTARAANPCIGPDRADLVLAGCAILEAIRRRWPSERMRVADRGLREGLLTDMMADDGVWRRGRARRYPRGTQHGSHEGNTQ
jgi:exopolyphosphatase/guanosine-5'-triphosphate,3'-diphosphate pyrophosphatase